MIVHCYKALRLLRATFDQEPQVECVETATFLMASMVNSNEVAVLMVKACHHHSQLQAIHFTYIFSPINKNQLVLLVKFRG